MAKDEQGKPCIVSQDRNNSTTLTQRTQNKVVASASGAINIYNKSANLVVAAQEEVEEEL